jgi:hypothetical protein
MVEPPHTPQVPRVPLLQHCATEHGLWAGKECDVKGMSQSGKKARRASKKLEQELAS